MSDLRRNILIKKASKLSKQFPSFDDSKQSLSNNDFNLDFEKVKWNNYFDEKFIDDDGFCVYRKGNKGPYLFLLHGAGHTSLSWSLVVSHINEEYRIVAYDMKNHGESQLDNKEIDKYSEEYMDSMWNIERMTEDAKNIIERIIEKDSENEGNSNEITLFLVGHSMGGAVASKTVKLLPEGWVKGLILIDIVEGSAINALPHMNKVIASRPNKFDSLDQAIKWAYNSKTIKNLESCKVSIPSQLIYVNNNYYWRVDLLSGEKYWKGWYQGLSESFLSCGCPKLLLLANTDRLDKPLTIAQMQGKFQLVVLEDVGHTIHEDSPIKTANIIVDFIKRQLQLKLILEKRLNN